MTYKITNNCIQCDRCVSQCPTQAVSQQGQRYVIDSNLCNRCVGSYSVPQCKAVCPVSRSAIASTPNDYWESWFNTYNRLITRISEPQPISYWEAWFNTYSQELKKVLQSPSIRL